ncbi:MAG: prolyl aminopeptidase [Betaproteobacteria bacterium]|nr:MAG: prolyl aminopeptidase [Betaproteobacteria bacterium]TMH03399.1 MAG: prolyl aminopeptidase [Betaproteobacteria bacterium]
MQDISTTRTLSREDVLYPPIAPNHTGTLALDELHTMYWEESGNPGGIPAVFLHGGPGGGSAPDHRRFFDPAFYRIIVYDQRGAGRSTPLGELKDNTTPNLVADLERLRTHLSIERWLIFGGSWGSTLALAYAQAHPDRLLGLVLRGIFLCRALEIDWFLYGMRFLFPEPWRAFLSFIPPAERGDLLRAYHCRLTDPDPAVHMPAAHAWSRYESACSTLLPDPELIAHFDEDSVALAIARIESHYFVNHIFMPENALLDGLSGIRHLPCVVVQGRYDAVCPILSADDLYRAWPEIEYIVVADAGHSAREPGIARKLVAATDRFRARLER